MQHNTNIRNGEATEMEQKLSYQKPTIKVVAFKIEQGFSGSQTSPTPLFESSQSSTESWHHTSDDDFNGYF